MSNNRSCAILSIRVTHHNSLGLSGIVWQDIVTRSHDHRRQICAFQVARLCCQNFQKNRGELPSLNPHIMDEPGRSGLVENVLSGAEKSLHNIAGHEQKPEWLGDIEPVQRSIA